MTAAGNFIPKQLTVEWLKEKYATGKITPEEVVDQLIVRSVEDADMNIWITAPSRDCIQPYLDRLADLDPNDAPLWGVPFAIKDNIDLAGVPTTAACAEFAYTPEEHSVVVGRLIAAGAIPMGKTNLDQFATGLVGTRSPYGETHNALNGELISGGSSAGSAVAVARGQAVFSLGTDTAGSGRVPAALNGLVGFKPSLGAWPTKGVVPACASLDCVTVFAHNAGDALIVDKAVRGVEPTDPWSRDYEPPIGHIPSKLALPRGELEFYGPYAEQYRSAWLSAVKRAEGLGLPVEYVDMDIYEQAASILYEGPWVAERWAALGDFVEANPGITFPVTETILRGGASDKYQAASVFRAMHKLQAYKAETRGLLMDTVLVLPTCGGTWTREQVREDPIVTNRDMGKYTNHCNLLDLCAIAIPSDDAAPELPFGITLFALADREDLIVGAERLFAGEIVPTPTDSEADTTLVAVCGLHMRGLPLEKQMNACGATFVRETDSAAKYRMVKLPTEPAKPGMIKLSEGGASIRLEVWKMPLSAFGGFAAAIPAPLGIGKVELDDGSEVPGFVCEAYAATDAEDITSAGGWRSYIANG
ncbi:allophanate hydrolase [Cohnella lupini]|uniref:Allophanate hydrolase n=1 Tax=Cohnella lupini TaxID=1294267 RepID=A0A3D9IYT2_9BACL|nr:allophanate hydrolase [Cohnella lupini]RED66236.1 allophanate hydrolase [Cohnella lupini]